MQSKRGISPLIATVLIIGFTIVLAALVVQWGGDLFKGVQSQTGVQSEVSQACSLGLANLDLKSVKFVPNSYAIMIDNKNDIDVTDFTLRVYGTGTVYSAKPTTGMPLKAQEMKTILFSQPTGAPTVIGTDVGLIPYVTSKADGQKYPCNTREIKTKIIAV